ncbi:MAG: PD-(D/E)XK nuclease family protein [Campylobacter sp.]|nr:PD-(D/E)XK nuclease family protein [Campylobacter sp.]
MIDDIKVRLEEEIEQINMNIIKNKNENFFTMVAKIDSETSHSNFIHSLLTNSNKEILKLFFTTINIGEFNTENINIEREYMLKNHIQDYGKMDIYIQDGSKHIILENKIWSNDGNKQLEKYINCLRNKQNVGCEKLFVLYLAPFCIEPTERSLGEYKIHKNEILDQNNKKIAYFKAISYDVEIIKWLEESLKILNDKDKIYLCIEDYIKVIKEICISYKNLWTRDNYDFLEQIIKDYNQNKTTLYENFVEVAKYDKGFIYKDFLEGVKKVIDKLGYNVILDRQTYKGSAWEGISIKKKKTDKFYYHFDVGQNYKDPYFGIYTDDEAKISEIGRMQLNQAGFGRVINMEKKDGCYKILEKECGIDFIKYILSDNMDNIVKNFTSLLENCFNENLFDELNDNYSKYIKNIVS